MSILEGLAGPEALAALHQTDIDRLCGELRREIGRVTRLNGGHLASSLGAVELTVALLRCYDPIKDRIVFDVGHQCYAWKLLTGRKDRFETLRRQDGISGFPKRAESPCDHFDTGHSSTALSAALGYAVARDLRKEDYHVVALVGDGAIINGEAFEALNHGGHLAPRMTCVLNDNGISIGPRIGGMALHLARLSSSSFYRGAKDLVKDCCKSLPGGHDLERYLEACRDRVKQMLARSNFFDDLGWSYWGPFDGHDTALMEQVFTLAKGYDKPLLIHVITRKGKGDQEAETSPIQYHGISPSAGGPKKKSWSAAVSDRVVRQATVDEEVVALTPAMGEGSALKDFARQFPKRYFDVGIAEEHMVTFAAGLAAGGMKPVAFIYSTFLQRAMDQLVHDVALQNLPVVFAVDRAGLIGEDGETHQGLFDLAWCGSIPSLEIWAPVDGASLEYIFQRAFHRNGPTLIRYPRGPVPDDLLGSLRSRDSGLHIPSRMASWGVIALGAEYETALQAASLAKTLEIEVPDVMALEQAAPLPQGDLLEFCARYDRVVTIEAGYQRGGLGQQIAALCNEAMVPCQVRPLGVPDVYVAQGSQEQQRRRCGLTAERILELHG